MKSYIISYDLIGVESNLSYLKLIKEIKKNYKFWAKPLKSFFIVKSEKSVSQIRDELKNILDDDDKLIVMAISSEWATTRIPVEITDWMKRNIL
jgi:CRISPR associated protein Cas2.